MLRESRVGPLGDKAPSALAGDQRGLYLMASDGREVVITRRMVRQQFLAAAGTVAARKATVRQWVRDAIGTALGAEQIDPAGVSVDFDETDGEVGPLEVS